MAKSWLIPSSSSLLTYAEQVQEVLAVGGDPWFLPNNNDNSYSNSALWDGTTDENAHFGGWETIEGKVAAVAPVTTTYAELAQEVDAVGGDPSFLVRPMAGDEWDGTVDEAAHFGGWEN